MFGTGNDLSYAFCFFLFLCLVFNSFQIYLLSELSLNSNLISRKREDRYNNAFHMCVYGFVEGAKSRVSIDRSNSYGYLF